MKRGLLIPILLLPALTIPAASGAQVREGTIEISPFGGYLFGGEFARGSTALFDFDVEADDQETYGLRVGFNLTNNFELELQASRTESAFVTDEDGRLFEPGLRERLGNLEIDYLMGYGTFNFGRRRAVPYVTLGAGVARLDPEICAFRPPRGRPCRNPDEETRFTASLGAGIKTFVNPHLALRFDGRSYSTSLRHDDDRHSFCDGFFCDDDRGEWLTNTELSFGVLLAF